MSTHAADVLESTRTARAGPESGVVSGFQLAVLAAMATPDIFCSLGGLMGSLDHAAEAVEPYQSLLCDISGVDETHTDEPSDAVVSLQSRFTLKWVNLLSAWAYVRACRTTI